MKNKKVFGLLSEIDEILNTSFENVVTFDFMYKEWNIGEKKNINGTENICVFKDKKRIRFLTEIHPGQTFDIHSHDCKEICRIISGELKDSITGETWSEGKKAIFENMQLHKPTNATNKHLFIQVDFIKE